MFIPTKDVSTRFDKIDKTSANQQTTQYLEKIKDPIEKAENQFSTVQLAAHKNTNRPSNQLNVDCLYKSRVEFSSDGTCRIVPPLWRRSSSPVTPQPNLISNQPKPKSAEKLLQDIEDTKISFRKKEIIIKRNLDDIHTNEELLTKLTFTKEQYELLDNLSNEFYKIIAKQTEILNNLQKILGDSSEHTNNFDEDILPLLQDDEIIADPTATLSNSLKTLDNSDKDIHTLSEEIVHVQLLVEKAFRYTMRALIYESAKASEKDNANNSHLFPEVKSSELQRNILESIEDIEKEYKIF